MIVGMGRLLFSLFLLLELAAPALGVPTFIPPRTGLVAEDIGLLINEDDPLSRAAGAHYQKVRRIPEGNVIRLHFAPGQPAIAPEKFARLKQQIDAETPRHVQAYAVAWTMPYRVGCMSLTSALAFGFDERFCSTQCGRTAGSPYFNAAGSYPFAEHGLRPAMMLAGRDEAAVRQLIDRGVAADGTFPAGRAYLLSTTDRNRNVRSAHFEQTVKALDGLLPVEVLAADTITARQDVLFYFTGLASVPGIDTLHFMPGALADHLTSFGGQLTDSSQMSALSWLSAGATASYGTVTEPCNHPQKFPLPAAAMLFYVGGATAIEAYWKSVAWPGEGVFVGEPLARPFAPSFHWNNPHEVEIRLFAVRPGTVQLTHAASPVGPFRRTGPIAPLRKGINHIRLRVEATDGFLRPVFSY